MLQKVPTNGTVNGIGYTALLNTQGTKTIFFKFTVAQIRELDDRYELLDSMIITIASGTPSAKDGFNNTIHRDSETIPNWVVEEGDQFAVFVPIVCTDSYCPANVNLLSNEDCESTLYLPYQFQQFVSKSDEFLRRVPVKVNINISISKYKIIYNIYAHSNLFSHDTSGHKFHKFDSDPAMLLEHLSNPCYAHQCLIHHHDAHHPQCRE